MTPAFVIHVRCTLRGAAVERATILTRAAQFRRRNVDSVETPSADRGMMRTRVARLQPQRST